MGNEAFDWDGYWRGGVDGGPMDAMASADRVEYLLRFLDGAGPPDSLAAVGCGDGVVPETVAGEFPGSDVWGFDVSEAVMRETSAERSEAVHRRRGRCPSRGPFSPMFLASEGPKVPRTMRTGAARRLHRLDGDGFAVFRRP